MAAQYQLLVDPETVIHVLAFLTQRFISPFFVAFNTFKPISLILQGLAMA